MNAGVRRTGVETVRRSALHDDGPRITAVVSRLVCHRYRRVPPVGVALSLCALIVVAWTVRTLGRQLIPGLAILPDHVLITAGPYRWLRHPMYSGALALWLGAALGTLNWLLLAIWPMLVFGVRSGLPKEEAMLRDKFGAQYDAYEGRTGRLLPRLGGRRPSSPT